MKERPILFSAPMVRAILEGRKTQTRRVMKNQPHPDWRPAYYTDLHGWDTHGELTPDKVIGWGAVNEDGDIGYKCPYGKPGDRLWVRETHCPRYFHSGSAAYKADWSEAAQGMVEEPRWTPSIHMRRSDSRILLEIVSVRAERLQDISEDDAPAEGISITGDDAASPQEVEAAMARLHVTSAVARYSILWESINEPGSWAANPWVWVIEFKRIQQNIP